MPINLDEFIRKLETVVEREPLMCETALRAAAEHIRDETKAIIGTEDEAWPALADATVEEKARLGYVGRVSPTDPLYRTGELRATIQVGPVSPTRAVVGTDDPIAPYLEFGTSRIPARPFIGTVLFRTEPEVQKLIRDGAARLLRGGEHG